MAAPQSDNQKDTSVLGWAPVREIPAIFDAQVRRAETAAVDWNRDRDIPALGRWKDAWKAVCGDENFSSAPLVFRLDSLNRAGIAYSAYGWHFKVEAELIEAEASWQLALQLAPPGWPDRAKYLFNIGALRYEKYQENGEAVWLERAIEIWESLFPIASPEDNSLARYHSGIAIALDARYRREGDLVDLEKSILHGEEALALEKTPALIAMHTNNLASRLRERFLRTREINDIQRSVRLHEESLQQTAEPSNRPYRLTNLGNALLERYSALGDQADLDRAVEVQQKAVDLTPTDDRFYALRLNNLGNSLRQKAQLSAAPADLEHVIQAYALSVQMTPEAEPYLASRLYNLANAYRDRFEARRRRADRQNAVSNYRRACQVGLDGSLEWALAAARLWGDWALQRKAWAEASEAYEFGLRVIDQLYEQQIFAANRETWLKEARDMSVNAAYVLARRGDLPAAVTVLEENRTRALNDALEFQELTLRAVSQEDRTALQQARMRIQGLEAEFGSPNTALKKDLRVLSHEIQQARQALTQILERIYSQAPELKPGALDLAAIQTLAGSLGRPLVYLLISPQGSLALLVYPQADRNAASPQSFEKIDALRLDGVTSHRLGEYLYDDEAQPRYLHGAILGRIDALKASLAELWPFLEECMLPITARLLKMGYRSAALIPTGLLSLLPLHAVHLDRVAFSYLPSARSLKNILLDQDHLGRPPAWLGLGDPANPGHTPLEFARYEVDEIARLYAAQGLSAHILTATEARRDALEDHLEHKTLLHFACHGQFNLTRPTASALYLSQGDSLTLLDILEGRFDVSALRLIVLSACQTGVIDFRNVPDEAVGFPAGFIQASVPGIISTLWPVGDVSTALLMIKFYKGLLLENLEPSQALQVAQTWLRQATAEQLGLSGFYEQRYRQSGQKDPTAYRYLRYYRANPQVRPYTHPYYWAGFTFAGV